MRPVGTGPTLNEVAQRAGVSPATVSRVLHRRGLVREVTRARVEAAMAELGYTPQAAGEVGRQPQSIALLVTNIVNPFFHEIMRAIEDEVGEQEIALVLYDSAESLEREQRAIKRLSERPLDGIIVCASRGATEALAELHTRTGVPLVVINRRVAQPEIPCITVDFTNGAYRATQHLLQLGHRRIGYLAGPAGYESSLQRRQGIVEALAEAGLELPDAWCPASFPSVEGGFQAMSGLLGLPEHARPSAIVAFNDLTALGALQAARSARVRVPGQLSLVGFDNIEMAAHSCPPLTTIEQPRYRMGRLAMQLLRQQLAGDARPSSGYMLLESPLIIRESTAPPR
jgi:LacI family transcriptional regulator